MACSTEPKRSELPERKSASEGFYRLEVPHKGYNPAVIANVSRSVGFMFVKEKLKYTAEEIQDHRKVRCREPNAAFWMREYCSQINSKKCDAGCEFEEFNRWCSGAKIRDLFFTAKHCTKDIDSRPVIVKFIDANGSLIQIPMHPEPSISQHKLPYDISALVPDNKDSFSQIPNLQIYEGEIHPGRLVFGIGFPKISKGNRWIKRDDYDYVSTGMRVTYGQITEANVRKWAYCRYTNKISDVKPESWILESSCKNVDYSKFEHGEREERNILIADTDMIHGMSGSPLFTLDGEVVGFGSTIKTRFPGNYLPYAIYSKAENISSILNSLSSGEK